MKKELAIKLLISIALIVIGIIGFQNCNQMRPLSPASELTSLSSQSPSPAPAPSPLPGGLGWHELPNTKLRTICPTDPLIQGYSGCSDVVNAWSGGIADTKRNRLIVWGGGHHGYWGNELFAVDLNSQTIFLLTNASPVPAGFDSTPGVVETYSDGRPSSRHTYNGLAYMADFDRMFSWGGSLPPNGFASNATWTFDLLNIAWKRMDPTNGVKLSPYAGNGAGLAAVADYDSNTKKVYVDDLYQFYSYDYPTNTYQTLSGNAGIDYHLTGVIDPKRELFIMIGNGQSRAISIAPGSAHTLQNWTLSGCDGLVSVIYPGLTYESVLDRIVGWAGGDSVYLLNPDTKSCTIQTFTGGPGSATQTGTNGRFRYFPSLGVIAVVNSVDENVFTLVLH